MKRNFIWLFVFVLISFTAAAAQGYKGKGSFSGYVYDEEGNPIEGVTVKLFSERAQSGFETLTDEKGRFRAFYVRGGPWKIEFVKMGYMPKKISAQVNEYSRNRDIEVTLEKVEGMVVTDDLRGEIRSGNDLYDAGKYEEAIQAYEAILTEMPGAFILYKNIGNCYFQMEDYEKAEEYYLKVLEEDPADHEILMSIGNTYANRGEEEKALEWYDKIEFEKINDPLVLFNIGSSFYTQSKYEQALKYYKKAVEIKGDFLDALYQLGLAYLTLGNKEEAIEAFNRYLAQDSDSDRAAQVRRFIEYLRKD